MRKSCIGGMYNSSSKEKGMLYALRKVFSFSSESKAEIFAQIVSPYGDTKWFGCQVVFSGRLDFITWRKIFNLSNLLLQERSPDFYSISKKSNLKLYTQGNE